MFEQRAEAAPDSPAILVDDRVYDYADVNARADRMAAELIARGVRDGDRLALLLDRSVDLVAAQLATLKCGAAYVPLDKGFPEERLAFLVDDCQARYVLTTEGTAAWLSGPVRLEVEALLAGEAAHHPERRVAATAPAYILYTSGSTGRPKGVVVPHRAISRLVLNAGFATFGPSDRVAFAANPAFDASTLEVWAPLLNGGAVVVIDRATLLEVGAFREALIRHGVTVLWMTAGLFNQYERELGAVIPHLRYLIVGGDVLDAKVMARVRQVNPPAHLLNGYGPTETTTFALTHEIESIPPQAVSIPIGRPLSNTRAYILDRRGEPVPVGIVGELFIGGDGVAQGYFNRPGLTAARFVPDPFSREPGLRLYRSGDLVRYLPGGVVAFQGRDDYQVKIRGFRIELGEIEARIAEFPGIAENIVLARADGAGDKRLVAYFVAAGDDNDPASKAPTGEALRRYLGDHLPEFMIPVAYVSLASLPLSPNGKVDRHALPAPAGHAYLVQAYETPRGDYETIAAGIWADLLKIQRVGRRDHFFEVGRPFPAGGQGHVTPARGLEPGGSPQRVVRPSAADRLRQELGAGRRQHAAGDSAGEGRRAHGAFLRAEQTVVPGRSGQPQHRPTTFPWACACWAPLDSRALRWALDRIVIRHEALRTHFQRRDGEPRQVIEATGALRPERARPERSRQPGCGTETPRHRRMQCAFPTWSTGR